MTMQSTEADQILPAVAPAVPAPDPDAPPRGPGAREASQGGAGVLRSLRPLAVDIAIPLGTYYLLRDGLHLSLWVSLAASSIFPAIRSAAGIAAQRRLNVLALLMLAVNLAGLGVSFATGDPRWMIAKDSAISSVIALAILVSVAVRRPLMTAGLKPWLTRGAPDREAAWDRLMAGSAKFRRLESLFSLIWGIVLLGECAARVTGAFTLPVPTMVWLGTVILLAAIGLASVVGGVAAGPMLRMVEAELK
jgi:hypothetical protein